ncbi:hypothetical protein EVAR_18849_1 [Eumeta japonica]|uniref:Uncharacterized protein n=1 Tax=Eumeta variegata TaxID=151549 RepID=A0A4C1UN00_EUMVA|nr:hypothetical protein EVAR_18849_1 [Eumeta japonica]
MLFERRLVVSNMDGARRRSHLDLGVQPYQCASFAHPRRSWCRVVTNNKPVRGATCASFGSTYARRAACVCPHRRRKRPLQHLFISRCRRHLRHQSHSRERWFSRGSAPHVRRLSISATVCYLAPLNDYRQRLAALTSRGPPMSMSHGPPSEGFLRY